MKQAALLLALSLLAACGADQSKSDIKGANPVEAARINTQLGIDYMRRGEMSTALEKLQRAIKEDPSLSLAHSSLAFVHQKMGNYADAEREYRKALDLDAQNPSARNNFGVFLCGQGKQAEAEHYFLDAAQDAHYTTPEAAWTNAGVCVRQSDPDKAEKYFRNALAANHEFPDALANMAWMTFQKEDYWRARAFLQRYELVGPATAETLWLAAQTERKLGDTLAAQTYEKKLRTEFPESEEASKLPKK